jgi:hypothetical protein
MKKIKRFFYIVLIVTFTPFALYAQSVELTFDNDLIVGSDDAYTGGMSIVYIGDSLDTIEDGVYKDYTQIMYSLFSTLTFSDFSAKKVNASVGISQVHITPNDIAKIEPIYNDTPYMGTSTVDFSLFTRDVTVLEHYRISVGVIGKKAGTKKVQEDIHKLTRSENPRGWHNQLGNKTTVGLGYLRGIRGYETYFENGNSLEWFYSFYGDVGNAYIGGGAGTVLRYGKNLPKNFNLMSGIYNPAHFNMLGIEERSSSFGYALDLGVSLNWIGEYYLYREGKRQGYDFYTPNTLLITKIGANIYINNFTFSLTLFPVFAQEKITKSASWGRINFGWNF